LQIAQVNGGTTAIADAQQKYDDAEKEIERLDGSKQDDEADAAAREDGQAKLQQRREEKITKNKAEVYAKGDREKAEKGRKVEEAQFKSSENLGKRERRREESMRKVSQEKGRKRSEADEKRNTLGSVTNEADRSEIKEILKDTMKADERYAKAHESFQTVGEDTEDAKKKANAEAQTEIGDLNADAEAQVGEFKQEARVKVDGSKVAKAKLEEANTKYRAKQQKKMDITVKKAKVDVAKETKIEMGYIKDKMWKDAEKEGGPAFQQATEARKHLKSLNNTAKVLKNEKAEDEKSEESWMTIFGGGLICVLLVAVGLYIMTHRLRKQRDYHTKMIVKLNQERIQNQKKIRELGNPLMDGEGSPTSSPDLKSIGGGDRAYWGMS